jgi:ubiquitin carboxyl-terminal hydrolase 5/13
MRGKFSHVSLKRVDFLTLCSHYVAFIRKSLAGEDSPSWILFNDEKVVECEKIEDMKKTAYLYFLTRV